MPDEKSTNQPQKNVGFKPTSSQIFILAAVVIVLAFLGFVFMFMDLNNPQGQTQGQLNGEDSNQAADQNVAAIVNGEKIFVLAIEKRFKSVPPELAAQITKKSILDNLIDSTLVLQETKKQGVNVDENDVQSLYLLEEAQAQQIMAQSGMTKEEILQTIREYLLTQKFLEEKVFVNATVSDKETSDFFEENKDLIKEVRASHILVEDENKAKELLAQLQADANFAQLAKDNSIDTGSAQIGGDLGFFPRGVMVKEFEDTAFALQAGQLSEIVQTQFGYHIILVTAINDDLNSFSDQIKDVLLKQKQDDLYKDLLSELNQNATIEIFFKDN